jgi:hypothetical protein
MDDARDRRRGVRLAFSTARAHERGQSACRNARSRQKESLQFCEKATRSAARTERTEAMLYVCRGQDQHEARHARTGSGAAV